MKRQGTIALAALAIALVGCGGNDGESDSDREAQARDAVIDLIAAFENEDYEAACDLQDSRANDAIAQLGGEGASCAEGYEKAFAEQSKFGEGRPFDDFVKQLSDYEVGDTTLIDEGRSVARVALEGPEAADSFLVEEGGELKVSDLFVTASPNTPNE